MRLSSRWERVTRLIGEQFLKNLPKLEKHIIGICQNISQNISKNILKNLPKYFSKLKIVETKLMTFYLTRLAFQHQLLRFSLVLISRSGLLWNNSRPLRQVEIAQNCEKNILSRSNRLQTSSYCLNLIWEPPTKIRWYIFSLKTQFLRPKDEQNNSLLLRNHLFLGPSWEHLLLEIVHLFVIYRFFE